MYKKKEHRSIGVILAEYNIQRDFQIKSKKFRQQQLLCLLL